MSDPTPSPILPSALAVGTVVEITTSTEAARDDRVLATRLPDGGWLCLDGRVRELHDSQAARLAIRIIRKAP